MNFAMIIITFCMILQTNVLRSFVTLVGLSGAMPEQPLERQADERGVDLHRWVNSRDQHRLFCLAVGGSVGSCGSKK